jgi:hypothetical protein
VISQSAAGAVTKPLSAQLPSPPGARFPRQMPIRCAIAREQKEWETLLGEQQTRELEHLCDALESLRRNSRITAEQIGILRAALVQRSTKVMDGKIVITRVGTWPMLSAFKDR